MQKKTCCTQNPVTGRFLLHLFTILRENSKSQIPPIWATQLNFGQFFGNFCKKKFPQTTLPGMFLAVNSLLLTILAKIHVYFVLLTRQVEPLPQLIDHESLTPALIAVNIAPFPWTSHSEILPGDFFRAYFGAVSHASTLHELDSCPYPLAHHPCEINPSLPFSAS